MHKAYIDDDITKGNLMENGLSENSPADYAKKTQMNSSSKHNLSLQLISWNVCNYFTKKRFSSQIDKLLDNRNIIIIDFEITPTDLTTAHGKEHNKSTSHIPLSIFVTVKPKRTSTVKEPYNHDIRKTEQKTAATPPLREENSYTHIHACIQHILTCVLATAMKLRAT